MFESVEKSHHKSPIWPNVEDFTGARAASRQGIVACLTVAGAAGILAALGLYGFRPWVNGWVFAAIVLFLAAAFGIKRASRVAAVGALLLFLIELVVLIAETDRFTGVGAAIVGLVGFANGVRGTFAIDRLSKGATAGGRTPAGSGHRVGPPSKELQRTRPAQTREPRR